MKRLNVITLAACVFTTSNIQAQPTQSDFEQKCIQIEESITQLITPDQNEDCFEALHYANANTLEAEMSLHFNDYAIARNQLTEVLNALTKSLTLSCQHQEAIPDIITKTRDLMSALPEEGRAR